LEIFSFLFLSTKWSVQAQTVDSRPRIVQSEQKKKLQKKTIGVLIDNDGKLFKRVPILANPLLSIRLVSFFQDSLPF
jgi:hypothetical protein